MKRMRIATVVVALFLPTGMASAVQAEGGTSAVCHYLFAVHFSPGLSANKGSGTYDTGGETGSVTCVGTVDGHRVTGAGTFGFEGTYKGDCFSGTGSGTYAKTLPTEHGLLHLTGTFQDDRVGLTSTVESADAAGGRGIYVAVPTMGDCLSAPVTDVVVFMVDQLGS